MQLNISAIPDAGDELRAVGGNELWSVQQTGTQGVLRVRRAKSCGAGKHTASLSCAVTEDQRCAR
jgi:hypothetical protein